jgi:flagellar assembly protein FliH
MSRLSSRDVSTVIDELLKLKDPAVVGLRRILHAKQSEGKDYPLQGMKLEEFDVPAKQSRIFSDDQRRILELERRVLHMQQQLDKNKEISQKAMRAAYQKGLEEGVEKGAREGRRQADEHYARALEAVQERIAGMFEKVESEQNNFFNRCRHSMLQLSKEISRKIIGAELSTRDDIICRVIKRALSYIADKQRLIVRVAENDYETVSGNKDFWMPVLERVSDIQIETDERLEKGSCIIESNGGKADARIPLQLDDMIAVVERAWENAIREQENCSNQQIPAETSAPPSSDEHPQSAESPERNRKETPPEGDENESREPEES